VLQVELKIVLYCEDKAIVLLESEHYSTVVTNRLRNMTSLMYLFSCKGGGCSLHLAVTFLRRGIVLYYRFSGFSEHSPMVNGKYPMQTVKPPSSFRVGCEISRRRFFGPTFFGNAINSKHYTDRVHEFLRRITEENIVEDRATCHTAWAIMREISF
jgi:hypothetical protein